MDEDSFILTDEELIRMAQEAYKEHLLDPDRISISGSLYNRITDSDLPTVNAKDPGAK